MNENTENTEPGGPEREQRRPAPRDLPRAAWDGPVGAWLRARGEDITDALITPALAKAWVKATSAVIAFVIALNIAAWWFASADHATANLLRSLGHTVVGAHLYGIAHTTTHPVAAYIHGHAASLPVGPTVLYAAWQLTGMTAWLLGLRRRATGARLLWVLVGAATGALVWGGTPAPGQALAAGVWTLTWGVLSLPLLRGLTFRAVNNVVVDARPQPAPIAPAAAS